MLCGDWDKEMSQNREKVVKHGKIKFKPFIMTSGMILSRHLVCLDYTYMKQAQYIYTVCLRVSCSAFLTAFDTRVLRMEVHASLQYVMAVLNANYMANSQGAASGP